MTLHNKHSARQRRAPYRRPSADRNRQHILDAVNAHAGLMVSVSDIVEWLERNGRPTLSRYDIGVKLRWMASRGFVRLEINTRPSGRGVDTKYLRTQSVGITHLPGMERAAA